MLKPNTHQADYSQSTQADRPTDAAPGSARGLSGAADTPGLVLDMDSDVHPLRLCVGSPLPHGLADQPAAGTSSLDRLEPGPSLLLRLSLCSPDGLFTRHSCAPNPRRGQI